MLTNRFETVLADTAESRDIHYGIRYQVFCEETGFAESTRFPDLKERDDFDLYATHFIIWDRLERQWVGAMRLVGGAGAPMPCETIYEKPLEGLESLRERSRELSRLCVVAKYRQTPKSFRFGLATPDCDPGAPPTPVCFRQEDHEILLRLLRASFSWGQANSIDYCYAFVNAAVERAFTRFGIPLTVVGPATEYRGSRIPHRYDVREAEAGLLSMLPSFANLVRNAPAYVSYADFIRGRAATTKPATAGIPG